MEHANDGRQKGPLEATVRPVEWTDEPTFFVDTHLNGGTVPPDVWSQFLRARSTAVEQLRRVGWSYEKIVETLNFTDVAHCQHVHASIQSYIREKPNAPDQPTRAPNSEVSNEHRA